jgi:pimeloyl-ACP methyl ester carboxylesterase
VSAPIDKFITPAGVETHLYEGGSGEPLLFLHGMSTADIWLPFHNELAKHNTVYAPDHPGFGRSAMPDWFDQMDDMVLHYAALLDELKIEKVNLVGFSLGGWIAAEFAAFYPERVNKLTLISAAGLRVAGAPIVDLFACSAEKLAALCFKDLSNVMTLFGHLMADPLKLVLRDYRERTMLARLAWNPGYGPKLARRLARFDGPALIIWGEDDQLIPSAHAHAYQQLIKNARVEMLADCGHMPTVERAAETACLINDFLAQGRD